MTTRLSVQDLLPNTGYAIRVRAVGYGRASEWSTRRTFTTISDNVLPSIPTAATWAVVGNSFHAEWNAVTENEQGNIIPITRYEIELVANGTTKIVSVVPATGSKVTYDLSYQANKALFGTAKPSITFRVRAVDNKELKSAWSPLLTATNAVPSAPTNVVAVAGTDLLSVSWTDAVDDDVVTYRVHVGTSSGFTPSESNKVFEGNATSAKHVTSTYSTHYFKVAAVDDFGQISPYVTSNGVTPESPFTADTTPPSVPTSLAGSISNTVNADNLVARAAMSWTQAAVSDLAGFYLRYRKVGDTTYSQMNLSASGSLDTGTTYRALVELQSVYQKYEFQVKSYDWSYNESAWSSTVTVNAPANGAPAQITGLSSVAGRDSIRYTWTPVSGTDLADLREYEVTFSTSPTFASGNITFKTGGSAALTVSGLTPGTTYYARVRANDVGGLIGTFSATNTTATLAQLTPGDIGAPTTTDFNNLSGKVDDSIKTYVAEYSVNSSETVAPTTGWSTATPTRTPGTFIWTRTVITYHDNTTTTTNPALLTGNTGATGSQGIQGPAGSDGVSLYTWLKYADTPTTGMSDTPDGKTYIGLAYNKTSSTESTNYADYSWSLIKGADGQDGSDGIQGPPGADGTTTYTWVKYADNASGGGMADSPSGKTYIGLAFNKTTATESTTATDYQWSLIQGPKGDTGSQGPAGRGISSTAITYQVSTNGTMAPTGTWSSTIPATSPGQYLWTKTLITYTDTTTDIAYSVAAHGENGSAGADGTDGLDGRGVAGTEVRYQVHTNGTTAPTGTWLTTVPATQPGQFLWTRTVTTYTDGLNPTTAYSVSAHGEAGTDGNDGVGISGTTVTYQKSTNGTTAPTGTWTTTIPATAAGEFLWTRTVTTYTDTSQSIAYSVAAHGATGATGSAGRGISSTAVDYAKSTSGTTAPTTWSSTIPTTVAGEFLWTRTVISYTSGSPATTTSYAVAAHGAKGDTGNTGATGTSVTAITPFYAQVATAASAPTQPTNQATPPAPWVTTEPNYVADTKLYRTDRITYSNGTYAYTTVTLVSSYTAAVSAMVAANGKNTIYHSLGTPGNTANTEGDTWFQFDAQDRLVGQWRGNGGTSWTPETIESTLIANLDVAKLTGGFIDAGHIETESLIIGSSTLGTELDAKATEAYVKSRGTNLITNGTGYLGDNTNFSAFTYDTSDAPPGAMASFTAPSTAMADELVPIDPAQTYTFNFWHRQVAGDGNLYSLVAPIDAFGNTIQHHMVTTVNAGTLTELTQPLNPGDTQIHVTDASNWYNGTIISYKYITFWDYTDPGGKLWEPETYSRNFINRDKGVDTTTATVINLLAPYDGPAKPVGTKLSNTRSGGSYIYPTSNTPTSPEWTFYSGTFGGIMTPHIGWSGGKLPQAVASVRIGWLLNYQKTDPNSISGIGGISVYSITEAANAQAIADEVKTLTDSWTYTGTTEINGGAIRTDTIDVIKLKAGSTFTQNLNVKSVFTLGDASTAGVIKSYNYASGTAGFSLSSTGLEINQGAVKASALRSGTLGSDTGVINIGAGASLVMNGGEIRSNTYSPTAGFKISTSGIELNDANSKVVADAFETGTLSSATITMGTGGIIQTAGYDGTDGFRLSSSGLEIPDGSLAAAKIIVTSTFSNNVVAATTVIDGGKITTGIIESNGTRAASVWNPTTMVMETVQVPAWRIDMEGDATLGNLLVQGNVTVGDADATHASVMQSANFVPGTAGWQLRSDGTGELLGLGVGAIDGESIKANTLTISNVAGGDFDKKIQLASGSSIVASGEMGETVSLSHDGFTVVGPHEAVVTAATRTTTTVTITTSENHGYAVGSHIYIEGLDTTVNNYDGQYIAASGTTGNTIVYEKTGVAHTASGINGAVAYGVDSLNPASVRKPQPVYVEFPTTIAKPNIISGTLQASILTVSSGATFRGTVGIEVGSVFNIASAILAPKSAPTVTASYSEITIKDKPGTEVVGIAEGHNGNLFVLSVNNQTGYTGWVVSEHTSSGVYVATRLSESTYQTMGTNEPRGIVYHNNNYYILKVSGQKTLSGNRIIRYSTSWVDTGDSLFIGGWYTDGDAPSSTLGFNHAGNRLVYAFLDGGNWQLKTHEYAVDATTGAIGAKFGTTTSIAAVGTGWRTIAFASRGNFDFGSERYVFKSADTTTATIKANYVVTDTAGAAASGYYWPSGNGSNVGGAYWDTSASEFFDITSSNQFRRYVGGDSNWTSGDESIRWFGYSYYRTGGAETNISELRQFILPKRAQAAITIAPIPGGTVSSAPDSARVYMARQDASPGDTGTAWKLRNTIAYPSTTARINPYQIPGATTPQATNGFGASSTPGEIRSTTGNSFWRGDDSAQFKQLRILSADAASTSAGNKPPLKVGNLNDQGNSALDGAHLRVDGSSIISMANDTTRGPMTLNADRVNISVSGGSGVQINSSGGFAGKFRAMDDNHTALVLDYSRVVAAIPTWNGETTTANNTVPFYAKSIMTYGDLHVNAGVGGAVIASGALRMDNPTLGSFTANVNWNNTNGYLRVVSSSERYKENIRDAVIDTSKVLDLVPRTFQRNDEWTDDEKPEFVGYREDNPYYIGFIAEEAEALGLKDWVEYDGDGKPVSFAYANWGVALQAVAREQRNQITDLQEENARLTSRLDALESSVAKLLNS